MVKRNQWHALLLCAILMFLWTACGGGGLGNAGATGAGSNLPTQPPTSTITSVTVKCADASVEVSKTTTCTATVAGTGSFNSSVTWSTSAGTITSAGVFTAPASAGTAKVTATSTQDSTKSGSATVTVTAATKPSAAVIFSSTPPVFFCDEYHLCGDTQVAVGGSNFTSDCGGAGFGINITPATSALSTAHFKSASEIDLDLSFDGNSYAPGQFVLQTCADDDAASNKFTIGMMSNRNQMAQDPKTGDLFFLDIPNQETLNTVYHYKADGTLIGTFSGEGDGMALDDKTGALVFVNYLQEGIRAIDENGNSSIGGGNGNGQWGIDIAAKGGFACTVQPAENNLFCWDISNDKSLLSPLVYPNLNDPCSIKMMQNGTELDAIVLSCDGNTISKVSVPDMNLKGALVLNELPTSNEGNTSAQVAVLSSGTIGVLSPTLKKLFLVDASSMSETKEVDLDGFPEGVVANEKANAFEVEYTSTPQAVPTAFELVSTTGTVTKLSKTSSFLPLGRRVSLDGTKIYLGDRGGKLDVVANQ